MKTSKSKPQQEGSLEIILQLDRELGIEIIDLPEQEMHEIRFK